MQDQHKKITGYRDLTAEEIELMNEVKALAEQAGALVNRLALTPSVDSDWAVEGKVDLQKGFMCLVRSIAKPTTF